MQFKYIVSLGLVVISLIVLWQFRYTPLSDGTMWDRWKRERCWQRPEGLECVSDRRRQAAEAAERQAQAAEELRLRWSKVDTFPITVTELGPGDQGYYDPSTWPAGMASLMNRKESVPPPPYSPQVCRHAQTEFGPAWLCPAGLDDQ